MHTELITQGGRMSQVLKKKSFRRRGLFVAGGVSLSLLMATPSLAQTATQGFGDTPQLAQLVQPEQENTEPSGRVRIQGRDLVPETGPDNGSNIPLLDFREEMRDFVARIAEYARRIRPNFNVIVEDALDLTIKRDDIDQEITSPARTFMRSIDGIIVSDLFSGNPDLDSDENKAILKARLDILDMVERNGLQIFVLDRPESREATDQGYREASKRGYPYQPRSSNRFETTDLPDYPPRPFDETGNSVVSLHDISNFAVVGNSVPYGREDEFALHMHQLNYDVVIVDVFHGRKPLSKQAVETLKYKATGARRLVFARIDIGAAASYRYYWQPGWQSGSPRWIGAPMRGEPDSYYVEFWRPEWQRIIFGDTASYVYGVIDQGYDGIVLGGIDGYQSYEGGDDGDF